MNLRMPADQLPPGLLRTARVGVLIRHALVDWLVIATCWLLLARAPSGWPSFIAWPLALLVISGRFHALGVVLHDACHMRADQRQSRIMPLLEWIAGFPIATSLAAMRYHHLRHHRYSGGSRDPYLKTGISGDLGQRNRRRLMGLLLVPGWIVRTYYGTLALAVPSLRNGYARLFLQDRDVRDVTHSAEVLRCLEAEPPQALLFTLLLAATAWYPPILVYYFLPLCLAGALNVNRVIVEHLHVSCDDRRADAIYRTAITHDHGVWGRLFLYPRNIGFHQAHHLYPTAALECLPALDDHLKRLTSASQNRP